MTFTLAETCMPGSPKFCYKGTLKETAKKDNKRTFTLSPSVRAGTDKQQSHYGYPAEWRLCYGSKCTSYTKLKGNEDWWYGSGYHSIGSRTLEFDVGTTNSISITLTFQVEARGSTKSDWDLKIPLKVKASATNTAPSFSGGTITVKKENKNGPVLTSYVSEKVSSFYIEWSAATDKEKNPITYTLEESTDGSKWTVISSDQNSCYNVRILQNYGEGDIRKYRVYAKDSLGYISSVKPTSSTITKNKFTLSALNSNPSTSNSKSPITFTFSSENIQPGVSTQYRLTCDKVIIHNCESVTSPCTINFYDKKVTDKAGPYILREDLKSLFSNEESNGHGTLTFTLSATNSNGSNKKTTKQIDVIMPFEPIIIVKSCGLCPMFGFKLSYHFIILLFAFK